MMASFGAEVATLMDDSWRQLTHEDGFETAILTHCAFEWIFNN